jgi:hypothetical protein
MLGKAMGASPYHRNNFYGSIAGDLIWVTGREGRFQHHSTPLADNPATVTNEGKKP